jgi:uncharacterized membrane protein
MPTQVPGSAISALPAEAVPPAPRAKTRLEAIDASRGLAMAVVCAAHFVDAVVRNVGPTPVLLRLLDAAKIASPMFILLSGAMLGAAWRAGPQRLASLRATLHERGLFLLVVAHWLILAAHRPLLGSWTAAAHILFMTDTIGVAILVNPLIVPRVRAAPRAALGVALVALSWVVIFAEPTATTGVRAMVVQGLFGTAHPGWWGYSFPLVPWIGLHLLGTVLGERLELDGTPAGARRDAGRLLRWGCAALGVAAALLAAYGAARVLVGPSSGLLHGAWALVRPFGKVPPSPGYFLTEGGLAMLAMALVFALSVRGRLTWLRARAAEMGQASLAIFVLQYYLFYALLPTLDLRAPLLLALYFVGSMVLLVAAARAWTRAGGNRLLRVPGLRRRTPPPPPVAFAR